MKTMFGWLTPRGRFIECECLHHWQALLDDAEMRAVKGVEKTLEELHEVCKSCQDHEDREGSSNAEWHIYEMASDEAQHKIVRLLYRAGYIRVGTQRNYLHFEGFPDVIKSGNQMCRDFAEGYGMEVCFEPTREVTV